MSNLQNLFGRNPVMQFSRKAARGQTVPLSDTSSPAAVSLGLQQDITARSDIGHKLEAERSKLLFNMMRFNFQQQKGVL